MSNGPWTDEENDLIVADYFAMLADDISARCYSKAEHRRALLPLLNDRSEGSVEFKQQNVRAVPKGFAASAVVRMHSLVTAGPLMLLMRRPARCRSQAHFTRHAQRQRELGPGVRLLEQTAQMGAGCGQSYAEMFGRFWQSKTLGEM